MDLPERTGERQAFVPEWEGQTLPRRGMGEVALDRVRSGQRRAGRSGGDAEQKAVIAALRALAREAAEVTGDRLEVTGDGFGSWYGAGADGQGASMGGRRRRGKKADEGPWPGSEIASVMYPIDPSEDVGWESRLPAFRRTELAEEEKLQKDIAIGLERFMKKQRAAARGPKRRIARGGPRL